ncbi:MAG: DoxX family membrane protein [Prolixibacteraceae bacterium]|nr:DoxX family membrane protein [Prolixibacteraceae bacterium]MDD4755905.1 DoxX family membrane protein [Prolixibacteraceae bacterium]
MKYRNYFLTILRIIVGWHFLYEGIAKLISPGWSAKTFLMGSSWLFSDIFHKMAESAGIMQVVDFLNIWGLILIGISLMTGFLVRWSSVAGSVLLLFYFVAFPPIPGYTFGSISEGSYLWVNKTLVEFFLLAVFAILPSSYFFGIDRLIKRWKEEKATAPIPVPKDEKTSLVRRELLRDMISVPFLGAFAYAVYKKKRWDSFEEKFLTDKPDAISEATLKTFNFASLNDLKGQVPKGKLGDLELSRLIMGGNLIGGWAHSRDLIYASKLVKAYHTDERVMMTMQLAEKCGINTILTTSSLARIVNKYWHETGGNIQFISDCGGGGKEGLLGGVRLSEEGGAAAMYCHGGMTDKLVQEGKFDEIVKALELIRSYGKPAGIGGHLLETIKGCVDQGIKPDFWVKTLHHHNYWSAQVDLERKTTVDKGYKDNIFCFKPQETIDFMNGLDEPWIAFKVLAAGAIPPKDAFGYAFENGADFICVGMYDFQIVEDSNLVTDVLNSNFLAQRERRWLA